MTEQLYGREGIEADSGYVPMPEPVADKPDLELERDEAFTKFIDDRAEEARPTIERTYVQGDGDGEGRKQPDNRTVEPDRAARDLADLREAEATLTEFEKNQALAAEIDAARGLRPQPEAQEQPHVPLMSELPQPQSAPTESEQDEIVRVLQQNPKVLAALHQQHAATVANVETAVNNAAAFAQQNAALAVAAILARPELQGISPQNLPGALQAIAKTNPALHAEIQGQVNKTAAVVQQAAQVQQAQQQKYAVEFHEWGKANDDTFEKSVAGESPAAVSSVRAYARQMLNEAGLSDQQILHQWNSNVLFRSAAGQQILADAARYRMAKAAIPRAVARPTPNVQRPGSSVDRPDALERDSFALEQRFPKDLSVKQATQLIQGRRARAR